MLYQVNYGQLKATQLGAGQFVGFICSRWRLFLPSFIYNPHFKYTFISFHPSNPSWEQISPKIEIGRSSLQPLLFQWIPLGRGSIVFRFRVHCFFCIVLCVHCFLNRAESRCNTCVLTPKIDLLPTVWLHSSVARALHRRYRGQEFQSSLNFSGVYMRQML